MEIKKNNYNSPTCCQKKPSNLRIYRSFVYKNKKKVICSCLLVVLGLALLMAFLLNKDSKNQSTNNNNNFLKNNNNNFLKKQNVNYHFQDNQGNLWFGTNIGLWEKTAESNNYNLVKKGINKISSMIEDNNNNIWLGYFSDGLWEKPSNSNTFSRIIREYITSVTASIECIFEDKQNTIWVGSVGAGLWYKLPSASGFNEFLQSQNSPRWSTTVSKIFQGKNYLWAMADGILYKKPNNTPPPKTKGGDIFTKIEFVKPLIINCLLLDSESNFWIGTNVRGLWEEQSVLKKNFTQIKNVPTTSKITDIYQDSFANVWIGVHNNYKEHANLYTSLYEKNETQNNSIFKKIPFADIDSVIITIYQGKPNELWIWSIDGCAWRYNEPNNIFSKVCLNKIFETRPFFLLQVFYDTNYNLMIVISDIYFPKKAIISHQLWTQVYDSTNFIQSTTFTKDKINFMFHDNKHNLWIGTKEDGVWIK